MIKIFTHIPSLIVVRWELYLVAIYAFAYLNLCAGMGILYMGLNAVNSKAYQFRTVVYSSRVTIVLLVMSIFTATSFETGRFFAPSMIDLCLYIAWIFIFPIAVFWLYLCHVAKTCFMGCALHRNITINTNISTEKIGAYGVAGFLTAAATFSSGIIEPHSYDSAMRVFFVTAIIINGSEVAYFLSKFNVLQVVSYSVCWFTGTFFGILILYLLF